MKLKKKDFQDNIYSLLNKEHRMIEVQDVHVLKINNNIYFYDTFFLLWLFKRHFNRTSLKSYWRRLKRPTGVDRRVRLVVHVRVAAAGAAVQGVAEEQDTDGRILLVGSYCSVVPKTYVCNRLVSKTNIIKNIKI